MSSRRRRIGRTGLDRGRPQSRAAADNDLIAHLGSDRASPTRIAIQQQPLGTGDAAALARCRDRRRRIVLVLFADHPLLTRRVVRTTAARRPHRAAAGHAADLRRLDALAIRAHRARRATRSISDRRAQGRRSQPAARPDRDQQRHDGLRGAGGCERAADRPDTEPEPASIYLTELVELAVADGDGRSPWPVATGDRHELRRDQRPGRAGRGRGDPAEPDPAAASCAPA